MPTPAEIEQYRQMHASSTDAELINAMHSYVEYSAQHVAAKQLFYERQHQRSEENQTKLLEEIRKPHWSVTPGFVVGFIAMVAACIAAYPVLWPPQEHKPVPAHPVEKEQQPAVGNLQSSPLPSQSLPLVQKPTSKK